MINKETVDQYFCSVIKIINDEKALGRIAGFILSDRPVTDQKYLDKSLEFFSSSWTLFDDVIQYRKNLTNMSDTEIRSALRHILKNKSGFICTKEAKQEHKVAYETLINHFSLPPEKDVLSL